MKTFLLLCVAIVGLAGFTPARANAAALAVATASALPPVIHINQVVVVERGHRYHHRHYYHHRRYYYRHHRRYYY